jgi:hypothetical protein
MVLSDQEKMEIILEKKKEIKVLSDELLGVLSRLRITKDNDWPKYFELTPDEDLQARRILNGILSDMSTIVGFCDKKSQKYLDRVLWFICNVGSSNYGRICYFDRKYLLDPFCAMANTLKVDFNKRPWKLAEFEVGFLDLLKARIKVRK